MELAGYLYPWDVVGDRAAPERYAALGLDHVVLAAAYHATRALTPRHPAHRVVTAAHSALYFRPNPDRWAGLALHPPQAGPSFAEAADALRAAGVPVHAWAVVDHLDPWPGAGIEHCVRNAYGDSYPWALCPSRSAVRDHALALAAELAELPGIGGVELEAAGWFGFAHLHQHDKTSGIPFSPEALRLLSLCFCGCCLTEYQEAGLDPAQLRRQVRAALDPVFAGGEPGVLDPDTSTAVTAVRLRVAHRLRTQMLGLLDGTRVFLHADPDPLGSTAFTGVDVTATAPLVAGLVVNCWSGPGQALATGPAARASLLAVRGMGGSPDTLPGQFDATGATGARLYHLGLAADADLAAVAALTAHVRAARPRAATTPATAPATRR